MPVAGRANDALEASLRALERKERTTAELAGWLDRRGYAASEVEAVIAHLAELGELDDERFARRYAEDKRELRGWGAERIREALGARGIEPALVEATVTAEPREAEVGRASDLLLRRGQALVGEGDRARALGYLTRRGYGFEVAHEAIRLAARRAA